MIIMIIEASGGPPLQILHLSKSFFARDWAGSASEQ